MSSRPGEERWTPATQQETSALCWEYTTELYCKLSCLWGTVSFDPGERTCASWARQPMQMYYVLFIQCLFVLAPPRRLTFGPTLQLYWSATTLYLETTAGQSLTRNSCRNMWSRLYWLIWEWRLVHPSSIKIGIAPATPTPLPRYPPILYNVVDIFPDSAPRFGEVLPVHPHLHLERWRSQHTYFRGGWGAFSSQPLAAASRWHW